jgi:hypothetical protein
VNLQLHARRTQTTTTRNRRCPVDDIRRRNYCEVRYTISIEFKGLVLSSIPIHHPTTVVRLSIAPRRTSRRKHAQLRFRACRRGYLSGFTTTSGTRLYHAPPATDTSSLIACRESHTLFMSSHTDLYSFVGQNASSSGDRLSNMFQTQQNPGRGAPLGGANRLQNGKMGEKALWVASTVHR